MRKKPSVCKCLTGRRLAGAVDWPEIFDLENFSGQFLKSVTDVPILVTDIPNLVTETTMIVVFLNFEKQPISEHLSRELSESQENWNCSPKILDFGDWGAAAGRKKSPAAIGRASGRKAPCEVFDVGESRIIVRASPMIQHSPPAERTGHGRQQQRKGKLRGLQSS